MSRNGRGVYTPQISKKAAFLLRRLAWAANLPMTMTLDSCIILMGQRVDQKLVCGQCKDRRCLECPLSKEGQEEKLNRLIV